jgi:hypothetical protein
MAKLATGCSRTTTGGIAGAEQSLGHQTRIGGSSAGPASATAGGCVAFDRNGDERVDRVTGASVD